ncbi:hypothetical protein UPYG_G00196040 [Umbra pygmaea]|uniref:Uncharacterized protein n=1 Tax=Umbra pygmaea TaxID=75934 RepID=A0ABD0WH70_UMBPY
MEMSFCANSENVPESYLYISVSLRRLKGCRSHCQHVTTLGANPPPKDITKRWLPAFVNTNASNDMPRTPLNDVYV